LIEVTENFIMFSLMPKFAIGIWETYLPFNAFYSCGSFISLYKLMFTVSRYRSKFFKAILVAFAATYLLFSVGILKSTHYCMGRTASVVFFSADSHGCACSEISGMENDSCCDDEHQVLKIEDDHQNISNYIIRIPQLYILDDLYTTRLITSSVSSRKVSEPQADNDLPPPAVPLFKTNCSFVFYDSEG
jgi:hypothetical protein